MRLGDKLSKLRKENNCTQEQLAAYLGVSRQAISKWESNIAYPETEKLIRIGELFHCSLDYLLKDTLETDPQREEQAEPSGGESRTLHPDGADQADGQGDPFRRKYAEFRRVFRERKSEKTLFGMPLWHIGRNAKGVIAIGFHARGILAIGLTAIGPFSLGLLSVGVLSFGLLSIGLFALGLLSVGFFSAGVFSAGIFSAGAISFGLISIGAIAIGDFSVGALSIGKYVAIGDHAKAMIALGTTQADGSVYQKIGELTIEEIATVKGLIDAHVPSYLSFAREFIKLFLS